MRTARTSDTPKSTQTELRIRHDLVLLERRSPVENEIVDADINDEAIGVQRPNVVVVGRGPTKMEIEHNVASGHVQHRTW